MFDSKEFKAMESSMQYLWMKQKVISQNISNYSTPGYKAQSLQFEEVLSSARENAAGQGGKYAYKAKLTTNNRTEARPDGNNVDIETESLELYQVYLQSSYLTSKINTDINNTRYVIKQAFK